MFWDIREMRIMPMKICVDCGTVFPAENWGAKRCCLCAAKYGTKPATKKRYQNPPVDALTADVRRADAMGLSYGNMRKNELLAKQKAREELEAKIERNRQRREKEKGQSE